MDNKISKKVFLRSNLRSPFDRAFNLTQSINSGAASVVNEKVFHSVYDNTEEGDEFEFDLTKLNHSLTLSENSIVTFANPIVGATYTFIISQDETGGHTLEFDETILTDSGAGITITVTASATDVYRVFYDGTNYILVGSALDIS